MCNIPAHCTFPEAVEIERGCIEREIRALEILLKRRIRIGEREVILSAIRVNPKFTATQAWVWCHR